MQLFSVQDFVITMLPIGRTVKARVPEVMEGGTGTEMVMNRCCKLKDLIRMEHITVTG